MITKKKIVVIAGGNGNAITIQALKEYKDDFDISAIVGVADSGGSSGILRGEFNTLPPGDIMRAVLAMSGAYDYETLKSIFYKKRFVGLEKLDKHNLGNLFLVLGAQYSGDYVKAICALEQSVEAIGKVYPSTLNNTHLTAELENGDIVRTEGEIDRPSYDKDIKIKKVWLEGQPKIYSEAAKTIEEADYIIFGPGSLYCSIIAAILPEGFSNAFSNTKAKFVYLAGNHYELNGETGPTNLGDCLWSLNNYIGRKIDLVIFNVFKATPKQNQFYKENKWGLMKSDLERLSDMEVKIADFENVKGGLDYKKLSEVLKTNLI